jgi:hypothetical protein
MQDVQMGKIISILDLDKIDELVTDLRKVAKPLTVGYYRASLPISLLLGGPKDEVKCERKKANYVQIFWAGRKILEFYGKDIRGNGHIFEENLGKEEYKKVLETLADHNMYTFRMWKKKNIGLRALMILFGVVNTLLGLAVSFFNLALAIICVLFGLFLIALYVK